ncbi:MAG: hypothetical protein ABJH68_11440 [Ilumatobacter sp.]|uniref:hypothetical protein n=1 Tax=Ilumatobacter sp. TaxID=1967498 RepID=UPI0032988230
MTSGGSNGAGSTVRQLSVLSTICGLVGGLLMDFDAALAPLDDDPSLGAEHPVNASSFL